MGTTYEIKVVAPSLPEPRRGNLDRRLASELEAINQKMSHYLPSSEVSEFNRFEGTSPFPLTPETTEVLAHALEVSALAGGAFDVTVAPLVNAWGFGPGPPPPAPPSAETIAPLRAQVGYERLVLDTRTRTVRKQVPSLTLDLSAIAKGYAVDRVAKVLQDEGFRDFMVEVGGEVRTSGDNEEGEPWRIAIERPLTETRAVQRVIALSGKSLATSGDYRNYLEWDDRRFAHIIDPRTGRPVEHRLASVSVVDLLCVRADSWATALMVLGPEEGHRVAVGQGLAALFVARGAETGDTFEERATPAWEDLLIAGAGRTMSEEPR
jgi:thiamine biosynthesis lipoprotein